MFINLMAINKNEDLIIDLPYMKFSNHFIKLTELFIEWTEPVHAYGYISSTLVDRNAFTVICRLETYIGNKLDWKHHFRLET